MKEPLINRAENNISKGKTYTSLMEKYNAAMRNGYYGEAELIVYAFIEDRLRAFIYYSNLIDTFNSNDINENAIAMYGKELKIRDSSCKMTIISRALRACSAKSDELSQFERTLRRGYAAAINPSEFKKILKKLEKWCKYRNEIVHGLLNKDLESLRQGYEQHVREGMELARYIDSQVQAIKRA